MFTFIFPLTLIHKAVTEWISNDTGDRYWLNEDALDRVPELVKTVMELPRAAAKVRQYSTRCTQTYHSLITGLPALHGRRETGAVGLEGA